MCFSLAFVREWWRYNEEAFAGTTGRRFDSSFVHVLTSINTNTPFAAHFEPRQSEHLSIDMINTMPNQQQHPHTRSHASGEPYQQQQAQHCNNNNNNTTNINNNNNTSTNNNNHHHHHSHPLKTGDVVVVPHVGPNQQKRPATGDAADGDAVAPRAAKRRSRKRPAVQLAAAAAAQQPYRYDDADAEVDARRGEAHAVALLRMRCERMDADVAAFANANEVAGAELIAAAFGPVAGGMESSADAAERDDGKSAHRRSDALYDEDDGADMYDADDALDRCAAERPTDGADDAGGGGGSADEEGEDDDEHCDEDDDDGDGNAGGEEVGGGRHNEEADDEVDHNGESTILDVGVCGWNQMVQSINNCQKFVIDSFEMIFDMKRRRYVKNYHVENTSKIISTSKIQKWWLFLFMWQYESKITKTNRCHYKGEMYFVVV